VTASHINLNDGVNEGLRCHDVPAFSVQYHPEAAPGPHDGRYLFGSFTELMARCGGGGAFGAGSWPEPGGARTVDHVGTGRA
jgi:carbamoyl-phosphate synthase small subunit